MLSLPVLFVAILAVSANAAPREHGLDTDQALRELVDLLQEQVRRHKEENELLRSNRMVYLDDYEGTYIWLVMQKDIKWQDHYTFEVSVEDTTNGEQWMAQQPITWGELNTASHRVTDGKHQGRTRGIKVMGPGGAPLDPSHIYRVTETVKSGSGGEEVFSKTKVYPDNRGSNGIGNNGNGNSNNNNNNGGSNNNNGGSNNNSGATRPQFNDFPNQDCRTVSVCRDNLNRLTYDGQPTPFI